MGLLRAVFGVFRARIHPPLIQSCLMCGARRDVRVMKACPVCGSEKST